MTLASQVRAESYHRGYWQEATPNGKSVTCRLTETAAALREALGEVGWHADLPPVDWEKDCAIVISPEAYTKGWALAFYGLEWTGEEFQLRWGSIQDRPSFGSAETIVVSFPHYVHSKNRCVCVDQGKDESRPIIIRTSTHNRDSPRNAY